MLVETRPAQHLMLHRPPECYGKTLDADGVGLPQVHLALASTPESAQAADALRAKIDRMMADGTMRRVLDRWEYFYAGEAETLFSEAQVPARIAETNRTSVETPVHAPPQQMLRVLVAEDNPTNQRLAEVYLSGRGHEVVVAANGQEALERALAGIST